MDEKKKEMNHFIDDDSLFKDFTKEDFELKEEIQSQMNEEIKEHKKNKKNRKRNIIRKPDYIGLWGGTI